LNLKANNKSNTDKKDSERKKIVVAVAGNPNSGKTTLFNGITGSSQRVGNYPGVTVEKKTGHRIYKNYNITFVDLPGTYSLSAYSLEEMVARDYILSEKPDVVVDVIDSSNLERNLYLASQILELDVPMIMALNMTDEVRKLGIRIDIELLTQLLASPAVETVASREIGLTDLLDTIIEVVENSTVTNVNINYGEEMEKAITELIPLIEKNEVLSKKYPSRWTALKLLENDPEITRMAEEDSQIVELADNQRKRIEKRLGDDTELYIADRRYGFVNGICKETVQTVHKSRKDVTEKIDTVLANRVLGLPIFLFMMWATFQLTFTLGVYPMDWLDAGFGYLGDFLSSVMPEGHFQSLIVDGIIGGVGGVLIFLPNILLLFLAIAFLEDTGYMARAAFIMDKVMHSIGLHGKSFMPMLIGFGCSVPAIMATRGLENEKDRLTTMLIIPLMSCGAKLPVYVLLAGAFFPEQAGNIIFLIYIFGILLAIFVAMLLKKFYFHGPGTPFVMELPPYRVPTLKSVLLHMWRRAVMYLQKAGTIILVASVAVWFITTFPPPWASSQNENAIPTQGNMISENVEQADIELQTASDKISNSMAGHLGRFIEPVIKPIGFDWKTGIALITGFAAKEVVVSTLGTVYALGETDEESVELKDALKRDPHFTPLVAFCLMIFTLIYVPCMAAMAVLYRESGSMKWTWFTIGYTTLLAWIVTFIIYQGGMLLNVS